MYINEPPNTCSKCHSTNSEHFSDNTMAGIRCKSCEHIKVTKIISLAENKGAYVSQTDRERREF